MIFFVQSQQKLAANGKNVALVFMEYGKLPFNPPTDTGHNVLKQISIGLTPETKYPTQYAQGVQALRHILSLGYQPSDVKIPQVSPWPVSPLLTELLQIVIGGVLRRREPDSWSHLERSSSP